MNGKYGCTELKSEIVKTFSGLDRNFNFYNAFKENEFKKLGNSTASAMVISQIITDYYTGLETLFHRISQFFGNGINPEAWHKDLLRNMTLEIEDTRPAAISDATFSLLDEILRFRHFRRYYFDTEYDWDRIEFMEKKYCKAVYAVKEDVEKFIHFLDELSKA